MSLRERLKSSVKSRVRSRLRSASDPVAAAGRGASAARRRVGQVQEQLEAVDAGKVPEQDETRSQAERAEKTAKMTAPIPGARLDPIDVPHPFEGGRQRDEPGMEEFVTGRGGQPDEGTTDDQPTMEDLVTGGRPDETSADDEPVSLLDFDDSDDDRGGLI